MADAQPIIVIKKKGHHGGHHGGAWKVAYADFVTAMMALFIVLWLLSSTSKQTQEQIAGYFNDPKGTATKKGSDGKPGSKIQDKHSVDMDDLKKQLQLAIDKVDLLNKLRKQIEITVTDEGLRVDLIEDKNGTFFELGSAKPTPALQEILKLLAEELKQVQNQISLEGHTDAQPYAEHAEYDNWELSSDRANEARREMKANGIRPGQVYEVRGFADQQLRLPDRPYDPANRRVSIVVQPLQASSKPARKPGPQITDAGMAKEPGQGLAEKNSATASHAASRAEIGSSEPPSTKAGTEASLQQYGKEDSETSKPFTETDKAAVPVAKSKPGILQRIKKVFGK
ncbi:MAG: flagellar motor protein MotB [Janthinobacterium lividum]